MGVRHATTACVWQQAFEDAVKEKDHFVKDPSRNPSETIFRAVLKQHIEQMESLASIQNDAVSDPSKPKSALEAL